jgi:hypothetical protein
VEKLDRRRPNLVELMRQRGWHLPAGKERKRGVPENEALCSPVHHVAHPWSRRSYWEGSREGTYVGQA